MTLTAESIRSAALTYNAEYPEAAAEILAGVPALWVSVKNADQHGRRYTYNASAIVIAPDGGHISSGHTATMTVSRRDGRERMVDCAARLGRKLIPVDPTLTVVIRNNTR